jgi:hypothetical protein
MRGKNETGLVNSDCIPCNIRLHTDSRLTYHYLCLQSIGWSPNVSPKQSWIAKIHRVAYITATGLWNILHQAPIELRLAVVPTTEWMEIKMSNMKLWVVIICFGYQNHEDGPPGEVLSENHSCMNMVTKRELLALLMKHTSCCGR